MIVLLLLPGLLHCQEAEATQGRHRHPRPLLALPEQLGREPKIIFLTDFLPRYYQHKNVADDL